MSESIGSVEAVLDQWGVKTPDIIEIEKGIKQQLSEAVHSLNIANFDQKISISKKEILEHLVKELGL